ncbi:zinc finger, CCHC-type containing protein [Tanacetum coccineum]
MVVQNFDPRHKMGLNMLLDIVIPDYNTWCPIKAKSCTYGCCFPKYKQYDYQVDSLGEETYWSEFHKLVSQSKDCSQREVACLLLSSMSPDLQRTLEKYNAYDMLKELKTMFEEQAKQELFETVKAFHDCKQEEGQSLSSYILKMKSYLDTLECLGYDMPNELGVSLILNSPTNDYDQFIQNYNMHDIRKTIAELHAMLKLHDKGIPKKAKTPAMLAIRRKRSRRTRITAREKDSVCRHYKEVGHWRRNCPSYQAELKKRKNASVASTSCILTIELYAFPNRTWVYDMGCGTHICNTSQGLRESRKLKHRASSLYMRNGMHATVKAIGSFDLILPTTKEPNVHWTLLIYGIVVFGHINKKRMFKLQRDGILKPTHDESLEKCKSCISGKMTCKPFPHQVERAKDLSGLIHTDVCGPFRTMSREAASYFINFTDDFIRYGYVYLMKHKHEVFETFKVFHNEVENQLGKKIKAI